MTDITRGVSSNMVVRFCRRHNTSTLNMAAGTLFGCPLEDATDVASFTLYILMRLIEDESSFIVIKLNWLLAF